MSKSIKISEQVYLGIRQRQLPRETYSETIARLLRLADHYDKALPLLREAEKEYKKSIAENEPKKSVD